MKLFQILQQQSNGPTTLCGISHLIFTSMDDCINEIETSYLELFNCPVTVEHIKNTDAPDALIVHSCDDTHEFEDVYSVNKLLMYNKSLRIINKF